jgi:uncharacterized membrane protein
VVLTTIAFRRRIGVSRVIFISGLVSLLIFAMCVAVPYHFQGYSQLENPTDGDKPLGWTALPFIGTFAYLYTFWRWAFAWLFIGLLGIVFGEISNRRVLNISVKGIICLIYAAFFTQLHTYSSTINVVLE